jgi:hypothetical protein
VPDEGARVVVPGGNPVVKRSVNSITDRWAERGSIRLAISANERSTRLSHDDLVSVK